MKAYHYIGFSLLLVCTVLAILNYRACHKGKGKESCHKTCQSENSYPTSTNYVHNTKGLREDPPMIDGGVIVVVYDLANIDSRQENVKVTVAPIATTAEPSPAPLDYGLTNSTGIYVSLNAKVPGKRYSIRADNGVEIVERTFTHSTNAFDQVEIGVNLKK